MDPCVCGHAVEEHPRRSECVECDCLAYEADFDEDDVFDTTDPAGFHKGSHRPARTKGGE